MVALRAAAPSEESHGFPPVSAYLLRGWRGHPASGDRKASMTGEAAAQDDRETTARRRLAWAWTGAGYAFFAIGLVGVVLPVLPTTIFWIIAAACLATSCPAMARKIYAWPGERKSVGEGTSV